ncbi:TPA: hypothetical protein ACPZRY_004597 [Yersinia enterocolitica]|uniref:hypothetical protein n=1 Tax=Yersinia enterocolitica TaxID=630 RepID=UPI0029445471|nr:hypothetical protein [Yersinia enterocolitica]EKN3739492.1 hypothetical protein [Yersinia enterocolitica]EKN4811540.1 hypothetical protein [Yersinia enterocolitica]ELX2242029.1 hypothetical protein [Yersinia enterocolitica]HDL6716846.1 hypothetical protein [Yersinia enterocolitica]
MLLCFENIHFPPLQPEHTGCGGHFQLFGICDAGSGQPIPTNHQLAVTQHPIGRQILPLLAGYTRPILGLAPSGPLGGKQQYGISDGKVYEFQPDNAGGWHGYPIPGTEAPPKILREFLARGDINKAEYNKLIKGK